MNNINNNLLIAKNTLLYSNEINESDFNNIFNKISTNCVNYSDLYFQISRGEEWTLEEGIVKSGNFNIHKGVGIRAISEDKTAFSYTNDISIKAINKAARNVCAIGDIKRNQKKIELLKISNIRKEDIYLPTDPLQSISTSKKIQILEYINNIAHDYDHRIKQVIATLSGIYEIILIARSDGLIAADVRPLVRVSIMITVEQNNRFEIGYNGGGGRFDYSFFTNKILKKYTYKAAQEALINLKARPTPAGKMSVVLGPGWPGILLHEAIGHGLESDFNRKGSSAFTGKIGKRVASKGVTIIDNGSIPYKRGSLNIDDEGNITKSTILIENGILCGYLQDTLNAKLMKSHVTGNARRESYASPPMPRMTNTYMINGDKNPEEIINSVENGLYAVNFNGGQVDITNGTFSFSASEAYVIKNGKITYPVKGATLIGSGPESLKYISMIGNDMKLDNGMGMCGKDGQTVPVGVGQPTIRIDNMTVGGTI